MVEHSRIGLSLTPTGGGAGWNTRGRVCSGNGIGRLKFIHAAFVYGLSVQGESSVAQATGLRRPVTRRTDSSVFAFAVALPTL